MSNDQNPDAKPAAEAADHQQSVKQDLRDWAKKFDASPEQIKEAIEAVGDQPDDVEAHLKGSRATTNSERVAKNLDKPR